MKAQFEVDDELWSRIRVDAMLARKTIGELLDPVLRVNWGGVDKPAKAPQTERKQPKVELEKAGDSEVRVQPPKPAVDQKACKHSYNADMVCWKCGWKP